MGNRREGDGEKTILSTGGQSEPAAPQAVRNALDRSRRRIHHLAALLQPERPLGRVLG